MDHLAKRDRRWRQANGLHIFGRTSPDRVPPTRTEVVHSSFAIEELTDHALIEFKGPPCVGIAVGRDPCGAPPRPFSKAVDQYLHKVWAMCRLD